ncbi:hypothetical protein D9619_010906 [Psilocybe cf. subviscida]|uniref:DUF6535 domain-containing protein n=1 Tax=Psilocybe cf. subviscida TaxID=2480587 RepID=A0A8H5EZY2_9AGAR|nr:hypothetical protein D9619_010906 [Psilocybe cf. subviscida]
MSFESNIENASAVDGEASPTHLDGGTTVLMSSMSASTNPIPQTTDPDVNLRDYDILLEQRVPVDDPVLALPQGDARTNPRKFPISANDLPLPKLSDPLTTHVPKPESDPFEHFLKPMLEKDTVQCNAWKDEVQNILIFAGLFSAVVTAFIIESYQRLQPDPNDAIIGILAHIAERLDNPSINGSVPASPMVSTANFAPSHSDITINIFWFISLVLSLSAALIGIITLQWLREHQRYDSALQPRETLAILHMRLDSLKRWYVPQIFAGLPLLLQSALVLFFAGMIEFMFVLRPEVAVPVTLTICIPLVFLIATTILPILQVCILQDPFRLSINNNVPSPCPYKSPQSLIARRIGTAFQTMPKFFAFVLAGAYECIIPVFWFLRKALRRGREVPFWVAEAQPPIFRAQKMNLRDRLRDGYPQKICTIIRARSSDWASIDASWLKVRTVYAVSLQLANRDSNDLAILRKTSGLRTSVPPEVYDCTRSFHKIRYQSLTRGGRRTMSFIIV